MTSTPYLTAVAELGCMICNGPAQIHHAKGGSMRFVESAGAGLRTGDDCALPLCANHHTGREGIHTIGVQTWEARFGDQAEMLNALALRLRQSGIAIQPPSRVAMPSKIVPRTCE